MVNLGWVPDIGSPVLGQEDWVPANDMRGSPFHSEDLRYDRPPTTRPKELDPLLHSQRSRPLGDKGRVQFNA